MLGVLSAGLLASAGLKSVFSEIRFRTGVQVVSLPRPLIDRPDRYFLSNQIVHKISFSLCFCVSDPLIDGFGLVVYIPLQFHPCQLLFVIVL